MEELDEPDVESVGPWPTTRGPLPDGVVRVYAVNASDHRDTAGGLRLVRVQPRGFEELSPARPDASRTRLPDAVHVGPGPSVRVLPARVGPGRRRTPLRGHGGGAHRRDGLPPRPVDVVILAFAVPDVRAGRTTATYRGAACPGDPLAFAVCDQGPAAAFTALRLAADLRVPGPGSAVWCSSSSRPCCPTSRRRRPRCRPGRPGSRCCARLRIGPPGAHRQVAGVATRAGGRGARRRTDRVVRRRPDVVLVLGGGLAGRPIGAADVRAVRTAPDAQPGTGVGGRWPRSWPRRRRARGGWFWPTTTRCWAISACARSTSTERSPRSAT